jgi:hypothetical protein
MTKRKSLVIHDEGIDLLDTNDDCWLLNYPHNLPVFDTNNIKRLKIRLDFSRNSAEKLLKAGTYGLVVLDEFVLDTNFTAYADVSSCLYFRAQKVVILLNRRPFPSHDISHVLVNLKPKQLSFIYATDLVEHYFLHLLIVVNDKIKAIVGKDVTKKIFELFFCQL